MASNQ